MSDINMDIDIQSGADLNINVDLNPGDEIDVNIETAPPGPKGDKGDPGENGVSAYGVLMYAGFIFLSAFIGYSVGIAPIVGFNFGSGNKAELKGLFKKSMFIISVGAVCMVLSCYLFSQPLSKLFIDGNSALLEMTCDAFKIYALVFLFAGFAIFSSGFFTALNDGFTSALISFLRTALFQTAAVIFMPMIWGTVGIWWSAVAAEVMAVAVSAFFIAFKRKKYGYI